MEKIIVKHTRIEINNYELGDCPKLEYLFSIYDPLTHARYPMGIEYDEENQKLIIPRGVDIHFIENLFYDRAYVDTKSDPYTTTAPIPIKYLTKDDRQQEILKFFLGMDNYRYTASKSQLSCNSFTGSGKTFVSVAYICVTGSRAMIIASSLNWLEQWKERIMEYTPLTEKDMYMIIGGGSINKILCRDPLKYQIFLMSHDTIRSYGDSNGWDKVEYLFKYLRCGLKIYDEAHLYFDNICKIDFHTNTNKTIYLTATPSRSNREEDTIYQYYFKNIPMISLFNEETDPHVNYVAMHFNSHPSVYDIKNSRNAYGLNRAYYTNYVVETENMKKLINIIIDMAFNIRGKVLIYIGTNQAIASVVSYINTQFPFIKHLVGIYTSVIKIDKEMQLRKKIIFSTTKSCGAASDISDLEMVVNLAEPFKTKVSAQQTLGRCRAANTLYLDIVDEGFYHTKKYYKDKKSIFLQYAKSCKDVYLSDEELDYRSNEVINKYKNRDKLMCVRVYDK